MKSSQMKQYWQQLADRIDAMTLRERGLIFAMLAAVLLSLISLALIDPLMAIQKQLAGKMAQEQTQMAAVQSALEAMIHARSLDPDALNRERLQQLKRQLAEMDKSLEGMQNGLVAHDKMAALLEDILRRNGQLQLVNLKTLPAASIVDIGTDNTTQPAASKQQALVYKHGVELTVQGNYNGLLNYLAELEKLPWQMFWSKAKLDAHEYPKVKLSLTLYTLSLDKAWLSI